MTSSPLAGVRVLVVDDTPDSLEVTALVLQLDVTTVLTTTRARKSREAHAASTTDE